VNVVPQLYGIASRPGTVALTFDDGPHPGHTPAILDHLERLGAPATFFAIGELAVRHPDLVLRAHSAGMAIGNHTWDHGRDGPFHALRITDVRDQLARTNRVLSSLGIRPTLFRPAGRKRQRPEVAQAVAAMGLHTVLWSIDPADWRANATPERIAAEVLANVHSGAVVLLHDGGGDRSATAAAIPAIIRGLRRVGLQPARLEVPEEGPAPGGHAATGSSDRPERLTTPHFIARREGNRVRAIVVHTNVGTFTSTASWFTHPESGVSAHYLVGLDGRVAQFVDEADAARHAGRVRDPTVGLFGGVNPNLVTVGVEFEDGGDPEGVARPDAQYRSGARLIREIAERWGIPLDREHVIGHREIFSAKSCPGNLDVERLIREARRQRPLRAPTG
jgi:peptidoglycan/xylan/chitin deacetylase (PgdA/CDA1 family)